LAYCQTALHILLTGIEGTFCATIFKRGEVVSHRERYIMRKLVKGLKQFRAEYVSTHQDLLEQLARMQKPRVLFITCSDSRVAPNLMTNADLGDLFVIRNAGNIIPPYGAANGGEGAAVEYAIQALDIQQIVVCGHSHCGAMKGLLQLGELEATMPLVYDWLKHAEATRRLVIENYATAGHTKEELLEIAVAENVLTQIENLKTYPVIHSRLFRNKLKLYAWIYLIETGEVLAYDPETHAYMMPQMQIQEHDLGEDELPGRYTATQYSGKMNSPVACELPLYLTESELAELEDAQTAAEAQFNAEKAAAHHGNSTFQNRSNQDRSHQDRARNGSSKQSTRYSSDHQSSNHQSSNLNPLWLSPEQADRIYRGAKR
jgi:carbonic anhydrase